MAWFTRTLALLALSLTAVSCGGGPSGPQPIAKGGFRAMALVIEGKQEKKFELSVRGSQQRWEGLEGAYPVLILDTQKKTAFALNPAKKTYFELPFDSIPKLFEGHPLVPGFEPYIEAANRGLEKFARESDTVFAGNACNLWRYDDRFDDPASPSTTFWVAPSLDKLVVKVDRETPLPDGTKKRHSTELRNVRRGTDPDSFRVPDSYTLEASGK